MAKAAKSAERTFDPGEVDLERDLDDLILGAGAYQNMAPYFAYLSKHFGRPVANLRSRYSYLRRRLSAQQAEPIARRGRPRKDAAGADGDLIQAFAEVFRVKPSREAIAILRDCLARYGVVRVAMAMERVRPEGGEVFARAIAAELGRKG